MILTSEQYEKVRHAVTLFISDLFIDGSGAPLALTKPEMLEAVIACDAWIESEQNNFNNALPDSVKLNASAQQKRILFAATLLERVDAIDLGKVFRR